MEKVVRREAAGPLKFFLDWLYDQGLGSEQLRARGWKNRAGERSSINRFGSLRSCIGCERVVGKTALSALL
jgi:hypothetical protein